MLRWVAWLVLSSGCAGKDGLAPVADAGPDHLITVGDTATLDATGSFDADGSITAYRWELLSWPEDSQATLADGGATPSLTVDVVGRYVISLVAVDNDKQPSIPDIVEVVATTPAQRPVARIELDGVIAVGQPIGLDGSGSTTPNPSAELEYAFSLAVTPMGSEAVIAGADDAARATFTPDSTGLYIAALTVSDDVLPSRAETVEVMVTSAPNRPPVADCGG
ncbi:MAG: PKD domain-containing protein, partial [Myxococcota bacterium]|nr:PKD domain-containing protein [Myxococcota bacterium]